MIGLILMHISLMNTLSDQECLIVGYLHMQANTLVSWDTMGCKICKITPPAVFKGVYVTETSKHNKQPTKKKLLKI